MKTALQIDGMSCGHCAKHVKEALEAVPGVKSAEVSLADKSAAVEHGDGTDLSALRAAVEKAGYVVCS